MSDKIKIIAEVAQAHDGSLGMAHSFIDLAADAGADIIKFQTHIADEESSIDEPWRVKFSKQDKTRFDYWKRMEFTEVEWIGLKQHCDERGIEFMSSPFSIKAVEMLDKIGVKEWKIASGEVTNTPLFNAIAKTKKPVLLSTGMSSLKEIDEAVNIIKKNNLELTVLQCTSMYPTEPEKLGLNMIQLFKERYKCKSGLSDHSGNIYSSLAAAALGADVIEAHITFSKKMFGPDVPVSLDFEQLKSLVEGVAFIEKALKHPVDKDKIADELKELRSIFNKSIVAGTNIPVNSVLSEELLAFKKPGTGLTPNKIDSVLGRKVKRDIKINEQIKLQDLE
ncbi:MAG TPA: N-acetylneuraminate synthase family protein [Ignavibacteria bacterium]|nr:N-acetylneuraminate synthase family protein [Ignavibacteria bacterium]